MPSRAVYTALAASRSDTGCSTVLIPSVEEPVIVTPGVVCHVDPPGSPGSVVGAKPATDSHPGCGFVPRQEYAGREPDGASRFLTGLVTCFATHGGIPAVAAAASRR